MSIFGILQYLINSIFNIFNLIPAPFLALFGLAIMIFIIRLIVGLL